MLEVRLTYLPDDAPLSSFKDVIKPNYIQALVLDEPIIIRGDLKRDSMNPALSARDLIRTS